MRCVTFCFGSTWSTSRLTLEPHLRHGPFAVSHSRRKRLLRSFWYVLWRISSEYGIRV